MASGIRLISMRQLRALAAVAHGRSVSEAAQRLSLTQPAVSLQLKNFEELAGLPILQRTQDGMVPTEAGEAILKLNERLEDALDDCATALDMLKGLTGGRVAIGAVSTAKYFAPFVIAAFSKLYPTIDLKLTIGNREEVMQGLRDFSLDLAITGRPPLDLDLETKPIGDHPHLIVGPPDHPLADQRAARRDRALPARPSSSGSRAPARVR